MSHLVLLCKFNLWQKRLGTDGVVYLSDPEQFDLTRFPPASTRYIFDYEICGSPVTGLDLITSHKLGSKAVLVTSYFNESRVQSAVEKSGARMLPKFMIPTVGITRETTTMSREQHAHQHSDVVLIDDDSMLHEYWKHEAGKIGLTVQAAKSPRDLDLPNLDRSTPIYVDLNLEGASGIGVARDLHDRGFTNISLAMAKELTRPQVPSFIRSIGNKDFPAADLCGVVDLRS